MKHIIVITVILYDNNDIKIDFNSGIILLTEFWIERFYVMTSKTVLDVCTLIKRKKSNTTNVSTCLFYKEICNEQHTCTQKQHTCTQKQWEALRLTAKESSGLDRYGFVYSEVVWEKVTQGEQSFFHRKWSKKMKTRSKLLQAKCRRDKLMESSSSVCTIKPSNSDIKPTAPQSPSSFSIISATTIVKPSESPEQESENTTSAPKRMARLSSDNVLIKIYVYGAWNLMKVLRKKRKLAKILFIALSKRCHGDIFVLAHLS